MRRIRIGVLGAARIAPLALVKPARMIPEVQVAAIATRDPAKADTFARRQGIPRVHTTYDALIADPELDAVYIPLPNGLHAQWTIRALEAGKHVLCEKPLAANELEAQEIADRAQRSGLVVMEAFHYRYHPLAKRMREILDDGELGEIRRITTSMCFPLPLLGDIRYRFDLAGGSLMDGGCYAVHAMRLLAGDDTAEPIEVLDAKALTVPKDRRIDRAMTARLRLPGDAVGVVHSSMLSRRILDMHAHVVGEYGEMRVLNYVMPHMPHRFSVVVGGRRRREHLGQAAKTPTYRLQLQAFADAIRSGEPPLTPASDAVPTLRIMDAIYRAAGLPLRGQTPAAR
ncbi:Gfo/Idh/MocA family oxidoreductase [Streptomyces sp. SID3343]|uniref:Gfo/Idh/MocA family protein n=1 Tax=Streptomyces sp. SID3343 TaxID=2690260 RepID=UPI001369C615|nr:Gfo/Idh/MocA family oxidoreductase [Streptomyces sp. SID3343]MYW01178.1 Gfo/Idh/MocA family oxidoreductase [Streptomyces sp. SID3343]